ncbi:hypothetical protein [Ruegeria atlantica]|uniref:hypothetical protein n=1 Tax=Ruegeria atlantica TaxID=81569 RepID=UPI002494D532|nr:hypothetical protein [Ruegeria atlantica]
MEKTLITSVTALAIVLSAGMSMAGPLRDHGRGGNVHDVRSTISQAISHSDRIAKTQQSNSMADGRFAVSSKQDLGQTNLSSTQQQSTYGTNWSSELPNVVAIGIADGGSYTWIIGNTSGGGLDDNPTWMHHR